MQQHAAVHNFQWTMHLGLTRTLVEQGGDFDQFGGYANNATVSGNSVILTGTTDTLNYVIYPLNQLLLTPDNTLTEVQVHYSWPGPPPLAPAGLYLGLSDFAHGHGEVRARDSERQGQRLRQ